MEACTTSSKYLNAYALVYLHGSNGFIIKMEMLSLKWKNFSMAIYLILQ